jgi:4Fe-4S binding domain
LEISESRYPIEYGGSLAVKAMLGAAHRIPDHRPTRDLEVYSMFSTVSETRMHQLRFSITIAWLLLIASLFYDPVSLWLTDPQNLLSPLRIHPEVCVLVQGRCLASEPYALGMTLFWSVIIPAAVLILLVFGHEAWRRICPLSFLSQIPRALGWQRQFKRVDAKTGKTRLELAKVKKDSWLARNHLYVQLGLLYLGLCGRLLDLNADRLGLALWLIATIAAAITVGYLYGGKSWCQYFCPMAPVQSIFAQPGGLLTSKAHILPPKSISQSMCRVVALPDGKAVPVAQQSAPTEQSACVACQSTCIDIDAERAYWDSISQPQQRVLYYGYLGLVAGFFLYHYLYAGNWDYYFSGAWARETQVLGNLLGPGFYVGGVAIAKLIAVPLFLAFTSLLGYGLGLAIEALYRWVLDQQRAALSPEVIQHRLFTVWTLTAFNLFFAFAGRPLVLKLPIGLQFVYSIGLVVLSLLWFQQAGSRSPDRYSREKLAKRFELQLLKLGYDLRQFMGKRRAWKALTPGEVMVLAKALPGFKPEQGAQAYRAVLQEVLADAQQTSLSGQVELFQLQVHSVGLSSILATQLDQVGGLEGTEYLPPAWVTPVHKAPIRRRNPLYRLSPRRAHRVPRPTAAPSPVSAAEVIRPPS